MWLTERPLKLQQFVVSLDFHQVVACPIGLKSGGQDQSMWEAHIRGANTRFSCKIASALNAKTMDLNKQYRVKPIVAQRPKVDGTKLLAKLRLLHLMSLI